MVQSFRDLVVWQRAMDLTLRVYEITKEFRREETYGFSSQMRRSAVSIPSNIAEGTGRSKTPELRQFLNVARGSNCELQTQLIIAKELKYASGHRLEEAEQLTHEVGRMIFTMLSKLGQSSTH